MPKTLTRTTFGVLSAEVIAAIDASNRCSDLQAAGFRFQTKLADLERQFEVKAGELRVAYLSEVAEIQAS